MSNLLWCIGTLLIGCVPVTNYSSDSSKTLIYDNIDYKSNVGMVQVYPYHESQLSDLENPVINLNDPSGFLLEFDLFQENYTPLYAKYIHCNANWKPSGLSDMRYLEEYNSFNINNYEYSANTRIQYIKYNVQLPTPLISGNYIIQVYGNSENDIVLTRRVLVYDNITRINAKTLICSNVSLRNSHQQIDFTVGYNQLGMVNPLRDFSVILLQNHNWQTPLKNLKPTLLRQDQFYLEYKHFSGENTFPGGNEFRYFDLRSIDYRGMNIINVQYDQNRVMAFVAQDKPKGNRAYTSIYEDINGKYFLVNSDPGDSQLNSEYADVFFELLSDSIDGDVYITGRFDNWQLKPAHRMIYDKKRNSYRGKARLKQGYYDYAYQVKSDQVDPNHFEGNFYQTQNEYEILLYYRNPVNNYDELVGYSQVKSQF